MDYARGLRLLLAGTAFAALVATAGLPLPGADRLGFGGTAAAQAIDIDYFYDQLDAYGEWVWHPRFGYVWLPDHVSESWRPYTVGHWIYTDEYGWYWDSYEPFAWAVYHYGRWGYDPDYGWFWVPGDTWAPAWVQWRYGDDYVGWAPIGPRREGYAYGVPEDYDPAVAEAWVFVPPRYLTSRSIYRYALPPSEFGAAFYGAPNVYRPQFKGGVVFNFGMPRDQVVRIIKRPIIVQKVYRVDRREGRYGKFEGGENGIRVFAPGFEKGAKPNQKPKRFVDSPSEFRTKTKLQHTFSGKPPKGWGPGAAEIEPVAKEAGQQGFKKHGGPDNDNAKGNEAQGQGGPNGTSGQGGGTSDANQGEKDKDKGKGQFGSGNQGLPKGQGGQDAQGGQGAQGNGSKGAGSSGTAGPSGTGTSGLNPSGTGAGQGTQGSKQGANPNSDQDDKNKDNKKHKGFGTETGSPQGSGQQGFGGNSNRSDKQQGGPSGPVGAGGDDNGANGQGNWKHKGFGGPNGSGGPAFQNSQGAGTSGNTGGNGQGNDKKKSFSGPGTTGGQNGQGGQGQGSQGQGRQGEGGGDKKDKCQKHPEKPECQKPN